MDEKVMRFIKRFSDNGKRQEVIDAFSRECCYWFAEILWERFYCEADECTVLYDPITNHWACQINGIIYDIAGNIPVDADYEWVEWIEYQYADIEHTKRLYRDCINFEED